MQILPMKKQQLAEVADYVADRFFDNPVNEFVLPDPERRRVFLKEFCVFRLRFSLSKNAAFVTEDGRGVAVWLAPGQQVGPLDLVFKGGLMPVLRQGWGAMRRMMLFVSATEKVEKQFAPMPHYLLSPLVVAEECGGRGYATRLLSEQCARFDEQGDVCFLHTQAQRTADFYGRFGFEEVYNGVLPGTTVPHIAMIRNPKQK